MKADYVHKDTLTATDYVELNKNNELLMSYNQALLKENQELKKQLEVGEQQYNDLVEEKEILQDQLSIKTLHLEELKLSKRDYTQENILTMQLELKNRQQKEFIEYLEKMWKETQDIWYIKILQKYKEIIGVKDENRRN